MSRARRASSILDGNSEERQTQVKYLRSAEGAHARQKEHPARGMALARRMMKKMGWSGDGHGLGKNETGMAEPVKAKMKRDTLGLGAVHESPIARQMRTFKEMEEEAFPSASMFPPSSGARPGRGWGVQDESLVGRIKGETVLLDVAAELEARLDHPDDDLSMESDRSVVDRLRNLAKEAGEIADTWASSKVRLEGATVALVGPVNAGKSSLFNHLVGSARALVSDRPGTTRDAVERAVLIDGMDITFVDTAGEGGTDDSLEQAGVELGRSLSAQSDLRVLVMPQDKEPTSAVAELIARNEGSKHIRVGTFGDRAPHPRAPRVDCVVDNTTADGIGAVRDAIRTAVGASAVTPGGAVILSQRQHDLFRSVAGHCEESALALGGALGPAVAASEVIFAVERLGELVGIDAREAVLDRLFSRFCIGK